MATNIYDKEINVPYTEMDGEIAFLNIDTGNYYTVNKTGSEIWKQIDGIRSIDEIVTELMDTYDVTYEECHAQVTRYITMLHEGGLIKQV